MPQSRRLTAIIEGEGAGLEEARANLIEALTLLFETADVSEVAQRLHSDLFVTQVEVPCNRVEVSSRGR